MNDRNGLTDDQKFGAIPQWMRFIMIFIDRVGFPILASIFLFYLAVVQNQKFSEVIEKMTKALSENTVALVTMKISVDDHMRDARPVIDAYIRELDGRRK